MGHAYLLILDKRVHPPPSWGVVVTHNRSAELHFQVKFNHACHLTYAISKQFQRIEHRTSFSDHWLDFRRPAFEKIKPKQKMNNSNFNPFYNNNY